MRKLNIKTKRNIILTTLAIVFYNISSAGYQTMLDPNEAGFGIPMLVFAGIAFLASTTALVIRLWNDAE